MTGNRLEPSRRGGEDGTGGDQQQMRSPAGELSQECRFSDSAVGGLTGTVTFICPSRQHAFVEPAIPVAASVSGVQALDKPCCFHLAFVFDATGHGERSRHARCAAVRWAVALLRCRPFLVSGRGVVHGPTPESGTGPNSPPTGVSPGYRRTSGGEEKLGGAHQRLGLRWEELVGRFGL